MNVRLLFGVSALLLGTASGLYAEAIVASVQGPVFVNRGAGFVRLANNAQLAETDRVMANPGGGATLTYSDGCSKRVSPGAVVTVGNAAQCRLLDGRSEVVPPPAPPPPAEAEACHDAYGNFDPAHCPALAAVGAVGLAAGLSAGLAGAAHGTTTGTFFAQTSRPISP